ncbi:MAG: hypothetical protein ACHQIK_14525 [Candidatus Acidiferrales bacterium]
MTICTDWKEPVYTDEQLDAIEKKRFVTTTEFVALLTRAVGRLTEEEKADFRRRVLANHKKSEEERLLKMKPATERIQ